MYSTHLCLPFAINDLLIYLLIHSRPIILELLVSDSHILTRRTFLLERLLALEKESGVATAPSFQFASGEKNR